MSISCISDFYLELFLQHPGTDSEGKKKTSQGLGVFCRRTRTPKKKVKLRSNHQKMSGREGSLF